MERKDSDSVNSIFNIKWQHYIVMKVFACALSIQLVSGCGAASPSKNYDLVSRKLVQILNVARENCRHFIFDWWTKRWREIAGIAAPIAIANRDSLQTS